MVFLNTLSADGKYPLQYCGSLQLPIQMQLSQKKKKFFSVFIAFLESTSIFKNFGKKDGGHSECVSEITDCEKLRHTTL